MKEECYWKSCSVNGWGDSAPPTDFSIRSLMRPTRAGLRHPAPAPAQAHPPAPPALDPRHDALLLSAYLFKLGYYQPAGPLIKESGAEAERALARYHPAPHYHPPHPPVLQQYGPPYYPPDLCYGRYSYRPSGPYHMPPQPDAQMVGVGGEPYPPPQYYGAPPCYQHSPQRIPYLEYRGCPCPLNACPKNVLIGPATGKAPTGGGPADVTSTLALPGAAFRAKVRACALEAGADAHGSGKDPPLELDQPAANAPHPCPQPALGGASPKCERYDVRDNLRLAGDIPGPVEALGPPSPARGSAGACAPQPPPVVPRRARLGKEMARRSLAGDDTGLLISTLQAPHAHNSDADDDVMAITPPICTPIDVSSSDERSTPLVDVKKENEGPTYSLSRKTDAQALREHNSTTAPEITENAEAAKAVKRRHSKPKLEIDMKDVQLEVSCKTNGIGEHVKLQKRRKVSGEQTSITRVETVTKEPKKKRTPKTPTEKKPIKRKLENNSSAPKAKKLFMETIPTDCQLQKSNIIAVPDDNVNLKPKHKSALLLDNLLRKNSIDRADLPKELNPAELFLSPSENTSQTCAKRTLNINNNIVEPVTGVRPNTIAAVSQHIEKKKLAYKNACKVDKVDSKITHTLKSVLNSPNDTFKVIEDSEVPSAKCRMSNERKIANEHDKSSLEADKNKCDSDTRNNKNSSTVEETINVIKVSKPPKSKNNFTKSENHAMLVEESHILSNKEDKKISDQSREVAEGKLTDLNKCGKTMLCKNNGQMKKSIEKVSKLLMSNKPVPITNDNDEVADNVTCPNENIDNSSFDTALSDKNSQKRPKLTVTKPNGGIKNKSIEKVAKLLVSRKSITKIDEVCFSEEPAVPSVPITTPSTPEINEQKKVDKTINNRCKLSSVELKATNMEKPKNIVKLLVSKKPAIKTDEATLVVEDACASPIPMLGRRPRRRRSGTGIRRVRRAPISLLPPSTEPRAPPRWSNGWDWDGKHYLNKVYLNNDSRLDRTARCWSRMTHASGDSVARGDCVLLRASTAKAQPFVARVASLWENPEDGEMMVSLVWYYRPEHTERGREPTDAPDEVFASRHRDANSVACIEDKCYVLTFNEYCRYRKRLKATEEGITIAPSIVPPLPASEITPAVAPNDSKLPPSVSPELVLFCRKIYDFRSKKIQIPNK